MNIIKRGGTVLLYRLFAPLHRKLDDSMLALGTILSNQQYFINSNKVNDFEFKIFSQCGEDGIIQYLIKNISIENKIFVEFGVENYLESNTRFLMMHNNWAGLIIDASASNVNSIKKRDWFWKYDLKVKNAFIDKDNINELLSEDGFQNIGLLSIDIDGNDYWIFEEINLVTLNPAIIIVEYNAIFGSERKISVPYDKKFNRTKAHYSNLFFGASLPALAYLAHIKGYELVGCNNAGTNAFFVRENLLNDKISKVDVVNAYKNDSCRQSRDENYNFSFLSGDAKLNAIKGLDVVNVVSGEIEKL